MSTTETVSGPGSPIEAWAFPLARLRGLSPPLRAALRRRHVTTCGQLLAAAAHVEDRARLAREAGLDPDALLAIVRRADLARVEGVGAVFATMLEDLVAHHSSAALTPYTSSRS